MYKTTIFTNLFLFTLILADSFTGKVVGVTDGDTFKVMWEEGRAVKVRLYGIDAPERNQAFGNKAKQFASDLVFGKEVRVEVRDVDRYGRTVGEIFLPTGENVNHLMVGNGYAWWYRYYAKGDVKLQEIEEQARVLGLGLWSDKEPVPPWDFRRGRGVSPANESSTVYQTKSGKKYHRESCRYAKAGHAVNLKEAVTQGLAPCKVCKPGGTVRVQSSPEVGETNAPSLEPGRCQATTQKGARCKRKAKAGQDYCWQHL